MWASHRSCLLGALLLAGALPVIAQDKATPACDPRRPPPSGTVAVFAQESFAGRCAVKPPGVYAGVGALGIGGPIASVQRGSFASASVCRRDVFGRIQCRDVGTESRLDRFEPWTWLQVVDSSATPSRCEPADDEVTFSAHETWGPCLRRKAGRFPTPQAFGLQARPETRPSTQEPWPVRLDTEVPLVVRTGRRMQARLCNEERFAGGCRELPASARQSDMRPRSLWAFAVCQPAPAEVALYAGTDLTGPCALQGTGELRSLSTLLPEGLLVRSFRLGSAVWLTACDEEDFNGNCSRHGSGTALRTSTPKSMRIEAPPAPASAASSAG